MKMTGSSQVMTGLDRCVRYVNKRKPERLNARAANNANDEEHTVSAEQATALQTGHRTIRVICVDPCFYRLTAAMAEKLGYVSAIGLDPAISAPRQTCGLRLTISSPNRVRLAANT